MSSKDSNASQLNLIGSGTNTPKNTIKSTPNGSTSISNSPIGKSITHRDQIHGDTVLDTLAVELLNTPALQRLGRVYQLGYAHLVFRGGTHTRLSHVIGACHMATKLVDALKQNYIYCSQSLPPGIELPENFLPFPDKKDMVNERWQFLRYTTSWAALLHDVGHIPMGHTLEDEFDNIYTGHDKFESVRIPYLWYETKSGCPSDIYKILINDKLYPDSFRKLAVKPEQVWQTVMLICLYKEKRFPDNNKTFETLLDDAINNTKKGNRKKTFAEIVRGQLKEAEDKKIFFPYMADIVGNTICADYLDYLRRDAYNVGLDVLWDDRVTSHFYVAREGTSNQLRMALALLDRNGKRRLDTCTGVLELVHQRFRFAEIIYYHKSKVSASAMFAKALSLIGKPPEIRELENQKVLGIDDISTQTKLLIPKGENSEKYFNTLKASCFPSSMMDPEIGDDSLHLMMQHNAWENIRFAQTNKDGNSIENNLAGIALLQAIARRRLYKTKMTIDSKTFATLSTGPEENNDVERRIGKILKELRSTDFERDKLEQDIAQSAGWPNYSVLLYVPPRKSQAKGIDTFALQQDGIVTLGMHAAVQEKLKELNNDYKNLWRIILLVSPGRDKDAIGLSKAVDTMLSKLWPDIKLHTVETTIRSACWFPYIREQEQLAAKDYMDLMVRAGKTPDWEFFVRVRHYTVEAGTVSTEEHVNRAYLGNLLGPNKDTENTIRERFPTAGMVSELVKEKRKIIETREGNSDEIEVRRQALEKIAKGIR